MVSKFHAGWKTWLSIIKHKKFLQETLQAALNITAGFEEDFDDEDPEIDSYTRNLETAGMASGKSPTIHSNHGCIERMQGLTRIVMFKIPIPNLSLMPTEAQRSWWWRAKIPCRSTAIQEFSQVLMDSQWTEETWVATLFLPPPLPTLKHSASVRLHSCMHRAINNHCYSWHHHTEFILVLKFILEKKVLWSSIFLVCSTGVYMQPVKVTFYQMLLLGKAHLLYLEVSQA